jgi:hypothetical protein
VLEALVAAVKRKTDHIVPLPGAGVIAQSLSSHK